MAWYNPSTWSVVDYAQGQRPANSGGLGGAIGSSLPFDPTPGFNIDAHAGGGIPFVSKGNGSTGMAPTSSVAPKTNAGQTGSTTTPHLLGDSTTVAAQQAAAQQAANDAAYNTYKGYANNDLSKLLSQYGTAKNQINDTFTKQNNQLQSGYNQAQADNQQAVTQQNQNLVDQTNAIRQGVHHAYQNAMNILGALGAGGSSAALQWAPHAASDFQNIQIGDANKNTAANLASLAKNYGDYLNEYKQKKEDLVDNRNTALNNAQSQYNTTKDSLSRIIDSINAQNMTPSDVATSLSAIEGQIPNLVYTKPTDMGVTPVYKAPSLASFEAPALKANLTTAVPDNSAATPAALYLASLMPQQKKQQNQPLQPVAQTSTLPVA